MEINHGFIFFWIGLIAITHCVHAQDQTGFISLDCGLMPKGETYTEKTTDITYISDASFVQSGESRKIKLEYQTLFRQQVWFLRSFPEGIRNCYNLNVTKGTTYFIRASFIYGNYDDQNDLPNFDLYLGPNKWTSVKIAGLINDTSVELLHIAPSRYLQLCLVKTGTTTPFISALELRPLRNDTYNTQRGSLMNLFRVYLSKSGNTLRFDEDRYDRTWGSYFEDTWTQISTSSEINTDNSYEPPELAMRTAATPTSVNEPLVLDWTADDPTLKMYFYLHLAEIETLKSNETREFSITLNGVLWHQLFSPTNLSITTIYSDTAESTNDGIWSFGFTRTENSTHPPLLNAIEAYTVIDFPQTETDQNEINAIKNIQEMYGLDRISWQGDPCAPKEYLWDGLNCSYKNDNAPRITSLNLSSSGLRGKIVSYIENLTQLKELDLSDNNLTGEIPQFLARMKSLTVINLSRNNFHGSVPKAIRERVRERTLKLNIENNPDLCANDSCKKPPLVPIVASAASFVIIIAALAIFFIFRTRKNKKKKISTEVGTVTEPTAAGTNMDTKSDKSSEPSIVMTERKFAYAEVIRMTNNFQRFLGKGGFGEVYHGYLNDKEQVAVKLLSQSSAQGYRQFKAEVGLLMRVHHKKLVSLVGYCSEGDNLALIYEHMANGDLREHLSGRRGTNILGWWDRLRIAADAAQGLEYLHNGCKPQIIHRDVKTTNILLNERFQAKLADFGLSRSFPIEGETHVSTAVAGTPGYLDPEYYRTNWLTEKSDVYSFGIVLLEIITNQPVVDKNRAKPHITEWISLMLTKGDISSIVDPKLQEDFDKNTAWKALELAMACVHIASSKRPTMAYVVMELSECCAFDRSRSRETEPNSSFELSMSFGTEITPGAR